MWFFAYVSLGVLALGQSEGIAVGAQPIEENQVKTMSKPLTGDQKAFLAEHDWEEWTGDGMGIWVSVDEQKYRVIGDGQILWETDCSTAEKGTGSQMGSYKTPLGWHSVARKVGEDAPWGQVFRARAATGEVWEQGGDTDEDLVLTRILILDGEEPGKNKGGDVDSRKRYIYVHGTNDEERIGEPASHGCIRLTNDDVIEAFEMVPEGTPLLITERDPSS